jgi:hypothetical protein
VVISAQNRVHASMRRALFFPALILLLASAACSGNNAEVETLREEVAELKAALKVATKERDSDRQDRVIEVLEAYQAWNVTTFEFNKRYLEALNICASIRSDASAACLEHSSGFIEAWDYLSDAVLGAAHRIPVPDGDAIQLRRLAYGYTNHLELQFDLGRNGMRKLTPEEMDILKLISQEARLVASSYQAKCVALSESPPRICTADLEQEARKLAS